MLFRSQGGEERSGVSKPSRGGGQSTRTQQEGRRQETLPSGNVRGCGHIETPKRTLTEQNRVVNTVEVNERIHRIRVMPVSVFFYVVTTAEPGKSYFVYFDVIWAICHGGCDFAISDDSKGLTTRSQCCIGFSVNRDGDLISIFVV